MSKEQIILLFKNTRKVIQADKLCKGVGIVSKVMPVPTSVSAECGMCIQVDRAGLDTVKELLMKNNIEFELYAK